MREGSGAKRMRAIGFLAIECSCGPSACVVHWTKARRRLPTGTLMFGCEGLHFEVILL